MRIEGNHTCTDCSKEFEWMSFIAPTSPLRIDMIDKPQAIIIGHYEDVYCVHIYCPHCRRLNFFKHSEAVTQTSP